jgi:sugar lactone lactonase YvrE
MQIIKNTPLFCTIVFSMAFSACTIHPKSWQPMPRPAFIGETALNEELIKSEKIAIDTETQKGYGPEDIVFDKAGNLYCGVHSSASDFSNGRILKINPTGKVEVFYNAQSWVAGLHFDTDSNLIALSHREGLIRISRDKKVTLLANKDENGNPFLIPNGLDIASDGRIYFSNTSDISAYDVKYGRKVILEMKPIGGFYVYDPQTNKVKTLIKGTYFGNGVVLSKDEDYALLVETAQYRVLKYWLKGPKAGVVEIFLNNLPGFPNGISIREDGSYWLGFSTRRTDALDKIHPKTCMKQVIYALPGFLQPKAQKFGMVMHISADGRILKTLFDTKGIIMPEAGAVKEHNGYLYLGGDVVPYIGKYKTDMK